MKKPRPEAILLNLPEEQEEALASWLLAGLPYHLAKARLKADFEVEVKSLSSFTRFYNERCAPRMQARLQLARRTAEKLFKDAKRNPAAFDAATAELLRARAFEILQNPGADPRDVSALVKLLLDSKKQDLQREQLVLDRDRFEFDATKKALAALDALNEITRTSGIDDDEKLNRARRALFGEVPE